MDIKDIRYFIAIAESYSMSQAARDLFISQPALSLIVKKLEKEFNTKLFIRKGNALTLTLAGEHLLKTGRTLLADHENLVSDMRSLATEKKEIIRFGISSFYSRQYVPDLFVHYKKNMPSVQIVPYENGSMRLEQMVIDKELEFCFVPSAPQREELVYRTIDVEELLLAIPKDFPVNNYAIPSGGRPYMEFKYVKHLPFILHSRGSKTHRLCERIFRHFDFVPNVAFETSFRETMYALTSAGIGVCILPEVMAEQNRLNQNVNFYRIAEIDSTRNYAVVHRPDRKFTPMEEHLIDTLTQLIVKKKEAALKA